MRLSRRVSLTAFVAVALCPLLSAQTTSTAPAKKTTASEVKAPLPVGAVTITVKSGEQQTLLGWGAGLNRGIAYDLLSVQQQAQISKALWKDLKFNTLRIWFAMNLYAPQPGQRDINAVFPPPYVAAIKDARACGVKYILMTPTSAPDYLTEQATYDDKGTPRTYTRIKADAIAQHAAIIADAILDAKDKLGIHIDVSGLQNEPGRRFLDWPASVKALRAALDERGLKDVKIIAPEAASADASAKSMIQSLRDDPAAWAVLDGIATHSYNMAATAAFAILADGKEYWQTESSQPGREDDPHDAQWAAVTAAQFLNDMNHGVTHWMYFIGFMQEDPKDNGVRIIKFKRTPTGEDWMTRQYKYFYLEQLTQAFDIGAVFRSCASSTEKEMTRTYGRKPRLNAAAARNSDGTWSIGIVNGTSNDIDMSTPFNAANAGRPAQTFTVTLQVEELSASGVITFHAARSSPEQANIDEGKIVMKNGEITLTIKPLELLTLRSDKPVTTRRSE